MEVMRRSLLPGLLRAAARNQAHQRPAGGLFEIGRTYAPRPDGLADEREWLAALRFGVPAAEHWRAPSAPVDVHAARGLADALAAAARVSLVPRPNSAPYLHPGRQARLLAAGGGEQPVGWAGEVHPLVLRAFDVTGPAAVVVIDLERLLAAAPDEPPAFVPIPDVPVSRRDVAALVPDDVPAAEWVALAREAGAPLVRAAHVFDRYAGAQVEPGHVSLALRLTLLDPARTLTDAEIEAAVGRVRAAMTARGARMRE
jgi:phenylalanyl-tRNA synthetase beta chain